MSGQHRQEEQEIADLRFADPHKAFDKAMEDLQRTQERLKAVRQKLDDKPVKITSKDGMISITMDSAGDVSAIAFNTQKWRRMAPAELGAALLAALTQAKAQSRSQLAEAYRPFLPEGLDLSKIMSGKFSVDSIFDSARRRSEKIMAEAQPVVPDASRTRKG
jgi:DNA-binding protein YbaB